MVYSKQFGGDRSEDPHNHLKEFLMLCNTIQRAGLTQERVRLTLFPFSLKNRASTWLSSKPPGHFTTWDALTQEFLAYFFPPSRTTEIVNKILHFRQGEKESFYQAWERFTGYYTRCPHHNMSQCHLIKLFVTGLNPSDRHWIDAAANGSILELGVDESYELI